MTQNFSQIFKYLFLCSQLGCVAILHSIQITGRPCLQEWKNAFALASMTSLAPNGSMFPAKLKNWFAHYFRQKLLKDRPSIKLCRTNGLPSVSYLMTAIMTTNWFQHFFPFHVAFCCRPTDTSCDGCCIKRRRRSVARSARRNEPISGYHARWLRSSN